VFSRFLWLPDIAVKFDFAKKYKPEWVIFTHSGFSFHGLAYDVSVRRTVMFISRFVQIFADRLQDVSPARFFLPIVNSALR